MGQDSKIEWTHHTFNPWRGCTKISPGCTHCYAEAMSHRNPGVLGEWGDKGRRVIAAESYWRQPLAWDRAAAKAGERRRVFCASLADVFEDRPELVGPRVRLFHLIVETPHLDWLLLTKRPENVRRLSETEGVVRSWSMSMPPNVWLGTSVEDQSRADERIPHLLNIPAEVRFLSCEPLLGAVEFSDVSRRSDAVRVLGRPALSGIHWVIAGGESGPNARPMHPVWVREIRDQCQAAGVRFHFKQWGEWVETGQIADLDEDDGPSIRRGTPEIYLSPSGRADRVPGGYEPGCPCDHSPRDANLIRVGKKAAGRTLDGRTWDELPTPAEAPHA